MYNLLDYISSVVNKQRIEVEEGYSQFGMNVYFSKFKDCIFIVDSINKPNFTDEMHYEFLFENIPYGWQRKLTFEKEEVNKDIALIMKHFNVNKYLASDYMKFITTDEIKSLRKYYEEGGLKK